MVQKRKISRKTVANVREVPLISQSGHPALLHGLQPGPEGPAHLVDVVIEHVGPLLLDGGLQGILRWVRKATGLALDEAPNAIIQG